MSKNAYLIRRNPPNWEVWNVNDDQPGSGRKPIAVDIKTEAEAETACKAANLAYMAGMAAGRESYRKSLLKLLGVQTY